MRIKRRQGVTKLQGTITILLMALDFTITALYIWQRQYGLALAWAVVSFTPIWVAKTHFEVEV